MTEPCESKDQIDNTAKAVEHLDQGLSQIKESQTEAEFRLRMQGEHIAQIKDASQQIVEGFKEFAAEMRGTVTGLKENQIKDHAATNQLRKEVEILFQDKRELRETTIPSIREDINKAKNAATVRMADCVEKDIVPLKSRVKVLEDDHLKADGKKEGIIESAKTARFLIPFVTAIAALLLAVSEYLRGGSG